MVQPHATKSYHKKNALSAELGFSGTVATDRYSWIKDSFFKLTMKMLYRCRQRGCAAMPPTIPGRYCADAARTRPTWGCAWTRRWAIVATPVRGTRVGIAWLSVEYTTAGSQSCLAKRRFICRWIAGACFEDKKRDNDRSINRHFLNMRRSEYF
jgi:hypothetical protein